MTQRKRPALRWLLYLAAAAMITLALLVGLLRLLLPLAPQYQEDIRAWASAATGYEVQFKRISAGWPLAGPELSFYEVSLTLPGGRSPLVSARELSAGVSLLRLLADGKPSVGHIAVRGMRLEVERTEDGQLTVQGHGLDELLPRPSAEGSRHLRIELEDIAITYVDAAREPALISVTLEELSAQLAPERLEVAARLALPEALGREINADISVPLPLPSPLAMPADWELAISGSDLNLVRLATFGLGSAGPLGAATGDVTLGGTFRGGKADAFSAEVGLRDLALVAPGGEGLEVYERLAGQASWSRLSDGWQISVGGLRIRRGGKSSPEGDAELRYQEGDEASPERWSGRAKFLRLGDLLPMARGVLAGSELEARLPRLLTGDLRDLDLAFSASAEEPSAYRLRAAFERLGYAAESGEVAVEGLTGTVSADGDGGRLELASRDARIVLSQWFSGPLEAEEIDGLLIWRTSADGVRVLSDDIVARGSGIDIRSRLELRFPADDTSPSIDLKATASAAEAPQVLRYLPLRRFPPKVVGWLQRAVIAGRVPRVTAEFRGPLREFPFDKGEGVFRVVLDLEDGTLDYADGWPPVEDLDGEVVFDGVSLYSNTNKARIGNLPVVDYAVRIRDLRKGVLTLSGRQTTGLDRVFGFLEATPLRRTLGPTLTRVTAGGNVATSLRLTLPIKNLDDYRLDVLFDARDCRLGLQRLPIDLKNLRGRVHLQNTRLSGDGLQAIMLGEPVRIRLSPQPAGEPYSHVVEFTGSTPVARVTSTFSLPLREYFDGQLGWSAAVRIPSPGEAVRQPLTVAVRSRLEGVASALPVPLRKDAAAIWPTELELRFPEDEIIDVTGRLTPPFSWALRLASTPDGWSVERGQLRAGPGEAGLPDEAGMEVVGAVADLRLGDWLDLGGGEGRQPQETYRNLELQIGQLATVGYMFPEVAVVARREAAEWSVVVRGPTVEGELSVPFDTETAPLRLDLTRLWLLEPEPGDSGGPLDPRNAPAFELRAADTILGDWRLGQVEMNVERVPDGLVARRIATRASSFGIDAEGAWRVMADDVQRQSSGIRATLKGNDVAATLQDLGFEPVMTGKKVGMKVDLSWPGSPGANIRSSASGRIEVDFEKGQVTNVEPGGGRILGLLSITALPRRLSLDFRDVFKEGLGFDSIKGDFGVESGVAYTCNLGLSGPAANIAVIGRTDLGGRLYDQLAVVRPEVSSMLAMGGAVLGGPVGGVTMLLISQIFSKPISTLGESYYRVTGGWDDPTVKRVQRGEVDADAFKDCERELAETLKAIEAAARANETIQSAPEEPR